MVSPTTAHLEAQYGVRSAKPKRPAAEDRLTIEPPPAALMCGTARRAHRYWPVRLTSSVRRQSSGAISSIGPVGPAMPALLIRMSMPPSCSQRQLEQAIDRCLVGDVGRDRGHLGQLAAQPVERRLIDVAGHDARTRLDEGLERDPADPGPARGQHHPLVIEPQIHTSPPQWLRHAPAGIEPPVTGSAPARLAAL